MKNKYIQTLLVALTSLSVLLSGCHNNSSNADLDKKLEARPPLIFATTEKARTLDPAAAVAPYDQMLAHAVFQRLMTLDTKSGKLLPDAAEECSFVSPKQYDCRLRKELTFQNGHPLTAQDVVFSLQRALRLNVPGTAVGLLNSVSKVEATSDFVVSFTLRWPDTQIGYVLSTATFSIVDPEFYNPDEIKNLRELPQGSGAFMAGPEVAGHTVLARFKDYRGAKSASEEQITIVRYDNPVDLEDAMRQNKVDVVWRGLSEASDKRALAEIERNSTNATDSGFKRFTTNQLTSTLVWNRDSVKRENENLRNLVAAVVQNERTVGSILPEGTRGVIDSFSMGGKTDASETYLDSRVILTMAYDTDVSVDADAARLLRDRLEASGNLSVRLITKPDQADLILNPGMPFVSTPLGYLNDYLQNRLPESAVKVASLDQSARTSTAEPDEVKALHQLQQLASKDLTVLPLTANPQVLYLAGADKQEPEYTPGWQPLLAALHKT